MIASKSRYRFSVEQYNRMIELGILTKYDRVELIRGDIVQKSVMGEGHLFVVLHLSDQLIQNLAGRILFSSGNPLLLAESETEPDVMLLRRRPDRYSGRKPIPTDVLLLIEVTDRRLEKDRHERIRLYAENGVSEYWIVNLFDQRIDIYRRPQPEGTYAETLTRGPGTKADLLAFPEVLISVNELPP